VVKGFKATLPDVYAELEACAHLRPADAIDRLNDLYPGADALRQFDNWPRIVETIQRLIITNEKRDEAWRASGNTSPLVELSRPIKRKSKWRKQIK
jgi:hypothetical protein